MPTDKILTNHDAGETPPKAINALTVVEAADYLGLKPATLNRWRIDDRGPSWHKVGGRILYDIKDLDRYFELTTHVPANGPMSAGADGKVRS